VGNFTEGRLSQLTEVSEEHLSFILRVEEQDKPETSMKQVRKDMPPPPAVSKRMLC
jgi:hypothetical protein